MTDISKNKFPEDIDTLIWNVFEKHYPLFIDLGLNAYGLEQETIEDLIQETFIKVFLKKKKISLQKAPSVRNFVVTAFRWAILDHLKQTRKKSGQLSLNDSESDLLEATVTDINENQLNQFIVAEEIRLLQEALKMLDSKYSKVIELSLQGLTDQEIADMMKEPKKTINTRKNRGIKKIKKIMSKL